MTRRSFITRALAAVVGLFVAPKVAKAAVPSERLYGTGVDIANGIETTVVTTWDVAKQELVVQDWQTRLIPVNEFQYASAGWVSNIPGESTFRWRKNGKTRLLGEIIEASIKANPGFDPEFVARSIRDHYPDATKMVE